jgi:hypothetical protein
VSDQEISRVAGSSLRARYNVFVDRHEVAWELAFAGLAIVFVVAGFADESPAISALEIGLTLVFIAEFALRLGASYDRRAYLRGHWIDLAAVIPTTRAVRLLRRLRLVRLVRAFAGRYRAVAHMTELAQHRGLAILISSWAAGHGHLFPRAVRGRERLQRRDRIAPRCPVVGRRDPDHGRLRGCVPRHARGQARRVDPDAAWRGPVLGHHRDRHELPARRRLSVSTLGARPTPGARGYYAAMAS